MYVTLQVEIQMQSDPAEGPMAEGYAIEWDKAFSRLLMQVDEALAEAIFAKVATVHGVNTKVEWYEIENDQGGTMSDPARTTRPAPYVAVLAALVRHEDVEMAAIAEAALRASDDAEIARVAREHVETLRSIGMGPGPARLTSEEAASLSAILDAIDHGDPTTHGGTMPNAG